MTISILWTEQHVPLPITHTYRTTPIGTGMTRPHIELVDIPDLPLREIVRMARSLRRPDTDVVWQRNGTLLNVADFDAVNMQVLDRLFAREDRLNRQVPRTIEDVIEADIGVRLIDALEHSTHRTDYADTDDDRRSMISAIARIGTGLAVTELMTPQRMVYDAFACLRLLELLMEHPDAANEASALVQRVICRAVGHYGRRVIVPLMVDTTKGEVHVTRFDRRSRGGTVRETWHRELTTALATLAHGDTYVTILEEHR